MKKRIIFIISLLFRLVFINAGLNKFLNYMPIPDNLPEQMNKIMAAFIEITWLIPLVGFVEILGGMLFIISKTRALGAIVIFPVVIGMLLTNIISAPTGLPIVITLFIVNLWIIYENRNKYLPLVE